MKKLLIILALLLVPISATADPAIEFSRETFDGGQVKQGTFVEHYFEFVNKGNSELIIQKVKSISLRVKQVG